MYEVMLPLGSHGGRQDSRALVLVTMAAVMFLGGESGAAYRGRPEPEESPSEMAADKAESMRERRKRLIITD